MAIQMTREEYQKIYGGAPLQAVAQKTSQNSGVNLGVADAFKGGISQAKSGYQQAKNATNPLQLLEGGAKLAAGGIGAAFSPLAPIMKPVEMGVNYAADKISNSPSVQKFAQSKTGETTSRIAEDVANVNTIAGAVAGGRVAKPLPGAVARATGEAMGPAIAKTGRVLKSAGEGSYGITVTPGEGTARALQTYKESSPNLMSRIQNTLSGESKNKPVTEANTAARYGLMGTEQEIGVQAGRYMKKVWNEKIAPNLAKSKGTLDMKKFFDAVGKKILKDTPELTRRADLIEGLEALKDQYKNVSKVKLTKLQEYKEGWTKTLPESTFKGKPIASSLKEVKKVASDIARDFIYKNADENIKQDYIDYGNLKSIREAGIKSGLGDPAKKSITRGVWQFVMDKAVTPVATSMGKILYRTGEGLEFVGESGAKKVGDIVGNEIPNKQGGFINFDKILKDLNDYDATPVKTNKGLGFGDTDTNFRLSQLKEKMQKKSLTDAEYKEAQELLAKASQKSP